MSDESVQSRGIGAFFFAAIPWVLGLTAFVWLGVYITSHDFNRQVAQEKRQAEVVGEKELPKAPLKITIKNDPRQCVKVESAHFDGDDLWLMMRRECGHAGQYEELHWRQKALDGTVVASRYENSGFTEQDAGEREEFKVPFFTIDPRATEVVITTTGNI